MAVPLIAWRACVSTAFLLVVVTILLKHYLFDKEELKDPTVHAPALVYAAVASVFNFLVIFYHVTNPPHPKFLLVPKRWFSIRLHLAMGILEISSTVAGLVAFNIYGTSVLPYTSWAAGAGIVHALTALYQTNLVFGAKIIMRPAYYLVSLMHLVASVATLCAPDKEYRLLAQYLVLCIFTWCRVYMALLIQLRFAEPAIYSLTIFLAGLTSGGFILGPLASIYMIVYLSTAALLWRWSAGITSADGTEWEELTRERVRAALLDTAAMNEWKGLSARASKDESDAAARKAFSRLDKDQSGSLDPTEVHCLLHSMNVHPTVRRAISGAMEREGGVDFPLFLRSIWSLGSRDGSRRDLRLSELQAMTTRKQRARAVFDSIDLDKSGELERFELAELLVQWGCPDEEVQDYLKHIDDDGDGKISFDDEFFPLMAPIWEFGFRYVLLDRARAAEERGFTLHRTSETTPKGDPPATAFTEDKTAVRHRGNRRASQ